MKILKDFHILCRIPPGKEVGDKNRMNFDPFKQQRAMFERMESRMNFDPFKQHRAMFERIENMMNPPVLRWLHQQYQPDYFINQHALINKFVTINDYSHTYKTLNKVMANQGVYELLADLTYEDINHLDVDEPISDDGVLKEGSSDIKSEITIDEFDEIVEASVQKALQSSEGKKRKDNFLKLLLLGIVSNYAYDAANSLVLVLLIILNGIAQSNHDAEILAEVKDVIAETKIVKDIKNVFVDNPEIEKPFGKMGYLRINSFVREGAVRTAPVASNGLLNENEVFMIILRRGNWLLIEVQDNNKCFTGWVEESKVIKFKLEY